VPLCCQSRESKLPSIFVFVSFPDGKPMLRLGDTGDWVGTFEGHKGAVWSVALNAKATLAASGAADFTGKIWNAVSGEEMHTFQQQHIVKSVAFNRDSQYLVTGSNEKLIRIYDLNQPEAGEFASLWW
jgi:serine-threonine kinase receptor-associated protein